MAYTNSGSSGRGRTSPLRADEAQAGSLLKVILALGLFLLLAIVLSCGRSRPVATRPLVFGLESEPERLDPLTIKTPHTFRVAWQIYEGLFGLDVDGTIEPRLAASWKTEDFRTWRFTLRDAAFHPSLIFGFPGASRQVTAGDVVWSYTSYCAPGAYASFILADSLEGCAAYNSGKSARVSGIRAIDSHTVEMRLITPEPFFLNRISSPWAAIVPKEAYETANKERWGLDIAVGTGPYRLVSRSDTEVRLVRNANYWDPRRAPSFSEIAFRVVKSGPARLEELRKGTLDVLPLSADLLDSVLSDGQLRPEYARGYSLSAYPTLNHHLIGINTQLIPDAHLRRAMSLGTNRTAIVERLLGGYADVITGPIPPAMAGYTSRTEKPLFDLRRARQELAQSGYSGEPLEMLVHELAGSERVGVVFQQQMRDIGVNVKLTKSDYGSLIGRVIKGEAPLFSLFAEIVFSSPEPLLISLFSSSKIPVPNFWRYSDPWVDSRLGHLPKVAAERDRLRVAAEVESRIAYDTPAIFLYSERHILVHSNRLEGIPVSPDEHFRLELMRIAR